MSLENSDPKSGSGKDTVSVAFVSVSRHGISSNLPGGGKGIGKSAEGGVTKALSSVLQRNK